MTPLWFCVYIVIFILLAVILFIFVQNGLVNDGVTTSIPADESHISTGDILGVGYHTISGRITTAWSSSIWSHTAVAWRSPKDNKLYILETATYRRGLGGVIRVPFDLWLHINRRHRICWLKLNTHLPQKCDAQLMDTIYTKLESSRNVINWDLGRLFDRRPYIEQSYEDITKTRLTCYELTIVLLQKMGIVDTYYTASSYSPGDIINRHVHMVPAYKYSDAVGLSLTQTSE